MTYSALERFQERHALNADGVVGPKTRLALSVPVQNRVRQIMASMERFRWIPRDLGSTNIVVNVPAFRLWFTQNGAEVLTMRTIVGKTRVDQQTPSFTDSMQYLVLNPNWNVPSSIAPVAPSGCPSAIDPPATLTRCGSISSSSIVARTTAANASLISNRSTSPIVRPACG